ncbi:MAG TPA: peptidylprolyl isomerase, partial [Terricaulis sp.]|nr:peptidylprolyl isomerase [Terricaulis sp.]
MNWKQACAAAAMAAALAGTAAPASAQLAEGVAAIVNDAVISTYDVRVRANMLLVSAGIQSTPEMLERARAQALRDLIDERLQLQEYRSRTENAISQDSIDRRIGDIARSNNMTPEQFIASLAQAGVPISTLREQIEADIAWQSLMSGLYGSRLRISEVEIRETQERLALSATRPQYLVSEIFLPANSEQEFQEMMQGGMRLIQEMQNGAPFPLVARQFSASPTAAAGGDMGWIGATELQPELQPIAERLQPGQVSMPVRTPAGVYIIALRERREGAAQGATTLVSLRQITAPAARLSQLQRAASRISGCGNLEREAANIGAGASVVDLGRATESDLVPDVRARIANVAVGAASAPVVSGEEANVFVVCARQAGGAAVPSREEIEGRLREREMTMLSDRYLR